MKVDLHLISWNRPKMTELVVKTIARNTKSDNYRLVVWDNGSAEDTLQMLANLHDDGYIDDLMGAPKNWGLEPARQMLLFENTYSPYFICVDNDCLPQPMQVDGQNPADWIDKLVDLMERNEEYAAISCRTQVMIGTGNIFEDADQNGDEIVDFPHPGGSLRIMRTKETRDTGGWRPSNPGRGAEERWICGKLREAGFKTGFATNIRTLHLFGTRGDKPTDRWGYDQKLKPKDTGHSDIWHPALENGDDYEDVKFYAGDKLAKEYFDVVSNNQ